VSQSSQGGGSPGPGVMRTLAGRSGQQRPQVGRPQERQVGGEDRQPRRSRRIARIRGVAQLGEPAAERGHRPGPGRLLPHEPDRRAAR